MKIPIALFRLGRIVATPGVLRSIGPGEITEALSRHQAGDWGVVSNDDSEANNRALESGGRILSVYLSHRGTRFWVMTEADRTRTTVLLPSDY